MKTEVQGRLEQSLHNSVWLTLGIERQDYRVQRPWSATIAQKSKQPIPLDSGTKIVEVFDRSDLDRQLLILGEPGAGKTTMMLELAEDLVKRAIADNSQPIPVLLSLSSWKNPKLSIFEWVTVELKAKYGLRVDFGKQWLIENQLLVLLDGLDEVATERQKDCAVALNAWLTEDLEQRPCGVLICCRREEFEQVVREPLNVYGAIYLQALTVGQIEDYFERFGLADVWETVQGDEALRELLTTPLFLSMFGLVQVQNTFELVGWKARESSERKIEYLFDTYWEAAMSRELIIDPKDKRHSKTYGMKAVPSQEQVLRSLVFTAKGMQKAESSEMLIEEIQMYWLLNEGDSILHTLMCGILYSLSSYLLSKIIADISNIDYEPTFIMLGAFGFGIVHSFIEIEYVDSLTLSFPPKISHDGRSFGRIFAVASALIFIDSINDQYSFAIFQVILLTFTLVFSLILGARNEIEERLTPNQGIKGSIRSGLILIVLILISYFLIHSFLIFENPEFFSKVSNVSERLSCLMYLFLTIILREVGGNAVLKHLALRIVLVANRYAPFRYDLLLNYCTERLLLQRIGGRYRFMHKTLQDYFAKMELD